MKRIPKGALAHLAGAGTLRVQVVPGARETRVEPLDDGAIRVRVTAPAEGGKANAAVCAALARALGVPKSRLEIIQGASAREKVIALR